MGYIKHDAIIVTSFRAEYADVARDKAIDLGLLTTPLVKDAVNGYTTFLIAPDGSKEGWTDSNDGDEARSAWKSWARSVRDDVFMHWVHVAYAGDEPDDTKIVDAEPKP